MARRFYFHGVHHSDTANMPQTNQHTLTPSTGKTFDAFTVNRSMNDTIGLSMTNALIATNTVTTQQTLYYHRFVSDPLDLSGGIASNTWTYNFCAWSSNLAANFPVNGNNQTMPINCYVWRPSTQTKVGTVLQGNSNANFSEVSAASTEKVVHGTFAGAAIASGLVNGDVVIFEIWVQITQGNTTTRNVYWSCDGTTVNTTVNATVTNHASFLETPEDLLDYTTPPTSTDMSVTSTSLNSKFITSI